MLLVGLQKDQNPDVDILRSAPDDQLLILDGTLANNKQYACSFAAWQNSDLMIADSTKKLELAYAQIKYIVAMMIKPFISKKWNVQESIKHLLLSMQDYSSCNLQGSVSRASLHINMQNFASTKSDLLVTQVWKKKKLRYKQGCSQLYFSAG